MTSEKNTPVERLFPFVLRSKIHVIGISAILRSQKHLQLIFLATDLSLNSKEKLFSALNRIPVVSNYDSEALSNLFSVPGLKVMGLKKSPLAVSILREFKEKGGLTYPEIKNPKQP